MWNAIAPTLARRLAIGFGVMIALLLTVMAVGQAINARIGAQLKVIVEVNERRMELANALLVESGEMAIALRTLTLLTDLKEVDQQAALLAAAMAQYRTLEQQLAEHLGTSDATAEELALRDRIVAVRVQAAGLIERAATLGAAGESTQVATLLMRDIRPMEQAWRNQLGALIALERQLSAGAYEAARATQSAASRWMMALSALSVAIAALLAWRLTGSVVGPVTQAIRLSERIADGDLMSMIPEARPGDTREMGRLLSALGAMQERLHSLVGVIRDSSQSIVMASGEIASGNADLSHRTESQSASLQRTASSICQLSGTVQSSAAAAQQADALAVSASSVARRGGEIVDSVVQKMEEISQSSQRIEQITAVIDGIAFRTNLLALNASVEAAQAGDKGRGFAIVADEVRSLAKRSAEAARDIKDLINASRSCVEAGGRLAGDAGSTMRDVVASTHRVTAIMSEILASSSQQSDGIAEVSQQMNQLDSMTQQNAALVEQSAAATESLKTQAEALSHSIGQFKLGPVQEG